MKLVVAGDGPLRREGAPGARLRLAREDRRALRQSGGRRLPVVPRGIRDELRRGDGARPARRRLPCRRAARSGRGRGDRACSFRPATSRRCAAALEKLLADARAAPEDGRGRARRILERFTWGPMLDRLLETYRLGAAEERRGQRLDSARCQLQTRALDIVIVSYRSREMLRDCLSSLRRARAETRRARLGRGQRVGRRDSGDGRGRVSRGRVDRLGREPGLLEGATTWRSAGAALPTCSRSIRTRSWSRTRSTACSS